MLTSKAQYTSTKADTQAHTETQAYSYSTSQYLSEGHQEKKNEKTVVSYSNSEQFVPTRCTCTEFIFIQMPRRRRQLSQVHPHPMPPYYLNPLNTELNPICQ